MRRAAAGDPNLGSAGAQSAVTIGSQALPLTGVVDQLELNVRAWPAVPNGTQTVFRCRARVARRWRSPARSLCVLAMTTSSTPSSL